MTFSIKFNYLINFNQLIFLGIVDGKTIVLKFSEHASEL